MSTDVLAGEATLRRYAREWDALPKRPAVGEPLPFEPEELPLYPYTGTGRGPHPAGGVGDGVPPFPAHSKTER